MRGIVSRAGQVTTHEKPAGLSRRVEWPSTRASEGVRHRRQAVLVARLAGEVAKGTLTAQTVLREVQHRPDLPAMGQDLFLGAAGALDDLIHQLPVAARVLDGEVVRGHGVAHLVELALPHHRQGTRVGYGRALALAGVGSGALALGILAGSGHYGFLENRPPDAAGRTRQGTETPMRLKDSLPEAALQSRRVR